MNNPKRNQKGATIIFFAFMMTVIIALMGLSLDGGYLYVQKVRLQNTADAAALACVINSNSCGASGTNIFPLVNLYGFDVTTTKPVTCPLPSQTNCVKAVAKTTWKTFFMWIVGTDEPTLSAVAIAGGTPQPPPCILALSGTGTGLRVQGNSTINATNCGIYANSIASDAMRINGNSTVKASLISIVGGYTKNGGSSTTGPITTNATALTDPFTDPNTKPVAPVFSKCDFTNFSKKDNGSVILSPGTYCGGIAIEGNYKVTLKPGLYMIYGGGITVKGNSSLTGSNVTIYNSGINPSYPYAGLTQIGNSTINISAYKNPAVPTNGAILDMLYWQDPLNTKNSNITGNSRSDFRGNIYLPTANLDVTGNSTTTFDIGIIANTISTQGNSNLKFTNTFTTSTTVVHASLYQ